MIETTQAAMAGAWLITTLLLTIRWMRQGLRKGNGCDAVQGQARRFTNESIVTDVTETGVNVTNQG